MTAVLSTSYPASKNNSFAHVNVFETLGPKYMEHSSPDYEVRESTRTQKQPRRAVARKHTSSPKVSEVARSSNSLFRDRRPVVVSSHRRKLSDNRWDVSVMQGRGAAHQNIHTELERLKVRGGHLEQQRENLTQEADELMRAYKRLKKQKKLMVQLQQDYDLLMDCFKKSRLTCATQAEEISRLEATFRAMVR